MRPINSVKAALASGFVLGLWHALWSTLVAAGLAQALVDFILRLHFMRMDIEIAPFAFATAAQLVLITFVFGAGVGLVFAAAWNWLSRRAGAGQA